MKRAAVTATPADHPDRPAFLSALATALATRFDRTGALTDLDAAIAAGQEAVTVTPVDHPHRGMWLVNLGNALRRRFERTGVPTDLDLAVGDFREALAAAPADHPHRAGMLSALGGALHRRFERTGEAADLDTAVAAAREAVDVTPHDHPDRAGRLSALAGALRSRFERTGAPADVDTAVDHLREAVAATPQDHPDRALLLVNLGNALARRFEQTGRLADLGIAVAVEREALAATPADHPARAMRLAALGGTLHRRFERTGVVTDLDAAVMHFREAVATTPTDHPDRAMWLSSLGGVLLRAAQQTGAPADVDAAVAVGEEAVAATPVDHPSRAARLSNLGSALLGRFRRTGVPADLDTGIDHFRSAVAIAPADHPTRAIWLFNLGNALESRRRLSGAAADLGEAVSCWLEASEAASATPSLRIWAARGAARLLAESGDGERAAQAAEAAVLLLPRTAPRRLERGDQQYAIGGFSGLAAEAAALALASPVGSDAGRAEQALRLLEAGRAVLLGQALETRGDLTALREHRPDLARRFVELRERLDAPTNMTDGEADAGAAEAAGQALRQEHQARDRRLTVDEFTGVLDEIRALDGFASFALPPSTEDLLAQADQGPVVVFNISDHRSDALLLTPGGVTAQRLPGLVPARVTEQIDRFRQARRVAVSGADLRVRKEARTTLVQVLQWLWDEAVGPVMEALERDGHLAVEHGESGESGEEKLPRVWWAPGGLLGQLPVHAAGHHTAPAGEARPRTVMDRAVSSYTPTVRALGYARERASSPAAPPLAAPRSLIVAMPTTPGLPGGGRLGFVDAEVAMLRARLPGPVLLREPGPPAAPPDPAPPDPLAPDPVAADAVAADPSAGVPTKAGVLAHLPECTIAHFACHGASDPVDPSKSLLLLHDHADDPLTVAGLAPVALDRTRLAYLSACRTAVVDTPALRDEAIHLTSAFQLAGIPHVIGTLWEIDDRIAVTVADLFYAGLRDGVMRGDCADSARALHAAVRKVRDGHGLPAPFDRTTAPLLWAAHVHAGA